MPRVASADASIFVTVQLPATWAVVVAVQLINPAVNITGTSAAGGAR